MTAAHYSANTMYHIVNLRVISSGERSQKSERTVVSEPRVRGHGVVIFDSKFGNTEKVARSLASGLKIAGVRATCLNVKDVQVGSLIEYDVIAVGAPTQALTASKPIKDFLLQMEGVSNLRGKYGFAFDTRFRSRLARSGAKFIEKKLTQLGLEIIRPRQSAIVKKTEGPLEGGEEEAFERIGFDIGTVLAEDRKNRNH